MGSHISKVDRKCHDRSRTAAVNDPAKGPVSSDLDVRGLARRFDKEGTEISKLHREHTVTCEVAFGWASRSMLDCTRLSNSPILEFKFHLACDQEASCQVVVYSKVRQCRPSRAARPPPGTWQAQHVKFGLPPASTSRADGRRCSTSFYVTCSRNTGLVLCDGASLSGEDFRGGVLVVTISARCRRSL